MIDPQLVRGYWTLAGFGFIGAALIAVPSTLLLDPAPPPEAYYVTMAGVLAGLACLALRWEYLSAGWLHLVGLAATVESAVAVAVFGPQYVAFFFLIGVFVAYISPDRRSVGFHLGAISVALLGPALYGPLDPRSSLQLALVTIPILCGTTGLFAYLRLRMVNERRTYRYFAEQTLALSAQIAGHSVRPADLDAQDTERIPKLARVRLPASLLAGTSLLLALPLATASLATAGIALPAFADDAFERVGIELPNQSREPDPAGRLSLADGRSARAADDGDERPRTDRDDGAAGERRESSSGAGSEESVGSPQPAAATEGFQSGAAATSPAGSVGGSISPPVAPPETGQPPDRPLGGPLDRALGDARQGVRGLLETVLPLPLLPESSSERTPR